MFHVQLKTTFSISRLVTAGSRFITFNQRRDATSSYVFQIKDVGIHVLGMAGKTLLLFVEHREITL